MGAPFLARSLREKWGFSLNLCNDYTRKMSTITASGYVFVLNRSGAEPQSFAPPFRGTLGERLLTYYFPPITEEPIDTPA